MRRGDRLVPLPSQAMAFLRLISAEKITTMGFPGLGRGSGLVPTPAETEVGALTPLFNFGWWFDRDFHGVTGSESDLDSDHAGFILPESPVPAGLSYFKPKSIALRFLLIPCSGKVSWFQGVHAKHNTAFLCFVPVKLPIVNESLRSSHYCAQRLRIFLNFKAREFELLSNLRRIHIFLGAHQKDVNGVPKAELLSSRILYFLQNRIALARIGKANQSFESGTEFNNALVIAFTLLYAFLKFYPRVTDNLPIVYWHNGVYYRE
jgi:hypothetical protein